MPAKKQVLRQTPEANKALVRRWVDTLNQRDLDAALRMLAPNYVRHYPAGHDLNLKAFAGAMASALAAFPDFHVTVQQMVAEGDMVVSQCVESGTHEGVFRGVAPTGKHWTDSFFDVARISGGKIVEGWSSWDGLAMLQQLGVIPDPQQVQRNKGVVRRVVEELWNQQKLPLVDELFGPEWVAHTPLGERRGLESMRRELVGFFAVFPDYRATIEDMTGEGDRVAVRFVNTMTHEGEFMGVKATGKALKAPEVIVYRLMGGKIAEGWTYWDTGDLLRQLGATSLPAQSA